MKKLIVLIFVCSLLMFLATCEKRTPTEEQVEQPISVSVEISGQQSHEVRIK